jgi:hypothetical protein
VTRKDLLAIKNPYDGQVETIKDECNCNDSVTFKYTNGTWEQIYKPNYKECWETLKMLTDNETRIIMEKLETGIS